MKDKEQTKCLWIDCETGGLDPKTNPILQLAGIVEIDGKIAETFEFTVKPFPQQICTPEALEINNLTMDQIENFTDPKIVYEQLIKIFEKYISKYDKTDKFNIVGYNVNFDVGFLRSFFLNAGDKYFGSWIFHQSIDIYNFSVLALMTKRNELKNFKLQTIYEYLELSNPNVCDWHGALSDVHATREIYYRLLEGF